MIVKTKTKSKDKNNEGNNELDKAYKHVRFLSNLRESFFLDVSIIIILVLIGTNCNFRLTILMNISYKFKRT